MCGIAGFVGKGNKKDLQNMVDALIHRGPDEEGLWFDSEKNLYLGMRRLAILDIESGKQPMWSSDKSVCIIFNGEIYNHLELRKKLEQKGYKFLSSHSDTETLIYAYIEWGPKMLTKLNGMWSFCIYDARENILFCSRDRFGKKPFYYSLQKDLFIFSSELKSLAKHSSIKKYIDKKSLQKYFGYGFIPAPRTLYRNIKKIPAGHFLIYDIDTRECSVKKYWQFVLEPFEEIPVNAEEIWSEKLCDLLNKAVKRRLLSDVPLGMFLSGGIDSTSILNFAVKHVGEEKLKTFSIGFEEDSFDETDYAVRAARMFNTEHYLDVLTFDKALSILSDIIEKLDEPVGDSSITPTYLLSQFTKKYVTVALSGDGGDELFAGYDPFKALKLANLYSKTVPQPVHQGIKLLASLIPVSTDNISFDFKLKRTLRGLSFDKKFWNPIWLSPLLPEEIEKLLGEPIDIEDLYSEAIDAWDNCAQNNLVDKTMQFFVNLYLQEGILVKVDRASMMNSLEVRSPFLDKDLVDFVRRIPWQYKYRNGVTKYILKKAMEPILPNDIIHRKKKGFGVPISKWFRDGSLDHDISRVGKYINTPYYNDVYKGHKKGLVDQRLLLWNGYVFNEVYKKS